jgi:hypothetical protein
MEEIDASKWIKEIRVYYHNQDIVQIEDPRDINQLQFLLSFVTHKKQIEINKLLNKVELDESVSTSEGGRSDSQSVVTGNELDLKIIDVLSKIFSAARSGISLPSNDEDLTATYPCEEEDIPF